MPFTGLPGEEQVSAASHLKRFHEAYGPTADPRTLYKLQPVFTRFAPIWPRIAFLLDSLVDIYWNLDDLMYRFDRRYYPQNDTDPMLRSLDRPTDTFEYLSSAAARDGPKTWLMLLRRSLYKESDDVAAFHYREHAHDIFHQSKHRERKMIVQELFSKETSDLINQVPVDIYSGFWNVRRAISLKERMLDLSLERLRAAVQENQNHSRRVEHESPSLAQSEPAFSTDGIEYGAGLIPAETGIESSDSNGLNHNKRSHVSFSPPRSPSPQSNRRGRPPHFLELDDDNHRRSMSRDTMISHAASSIMTYAPSEPDVFSISMKVFSSSLNQWIEAIAIMDTGCEGGNFISSAFLESHLDMASAVSTDPAGEADSFVDFAGRMDFAPTSHVELKWYGREIESGRKGKRTEESTSWFRVAPHLPAERGESEAPFQILMGKEWLHENKAWMYRALSALRHDQEVSKYRMLRLFKSRERKELRFDAQHQAELQRRQRLREEAEMERLSYRLASDASSITTGTSGGNSPNPQLGTPTPPPTFGRQNSRASTQSLSSTLTGSSQQSNGVGGAVDAHAVP